MVPLDVRRVSYPSPSGCAARGTSPELHEKQLVTRARTPRWIRIALICIGAIAGAFLPFVTHGASSPGFTDIEAKLGYATLAVLVNAGYGALVGWAIGALISYLRGDRGGRASR